MQVNKTKNQNVNSNIASSISSHWCLLWQCTLKKPSWGLPRSVFF